MYHHHDHLYDTQLSCSVPLSIFWYNEVPSAKKLRIMVDIHKYFLEHPEYLTDGVILLQFFISNSEAVVGKLCPQVSCIDSILMPLDLLNLVKNLAWLGPDGSEDLQLDKAALLPPLYLEATMLDPVVRPTNNPATTRIPLKICSCNPRISTKSR